MNIDILSDQQNKLLTVRITGNLISTSVDSIRADIEKCLTVSAGQSPPWRTFQLDLSSSTMVDSVGLNFIVTLFKTVQKLGGKMQLLYKNPNVHRTLLFTRMDRFIELIQA